VLEIQNSRYLPSVVYRDETGQLVTGRSAVRQAVAFPKHAERIPKRSLVVGDLRACCALLATVGMWQKSWPMRKR
jgi:hypothetical protein